MTWEPPVGGLQNRYYTHPPGLDDVGLGPNLKKTLFSAQHFRWSRFNWGWILNIVTFSFSWWSETLLIYWTEQGAPMRSPSSGSLGSREVFCFCFGVYMEYKLPLKAPSMSSRWDSEALEINDCLTVIQSERQPFHHTTSSALSASFCLLAHLIQTCSSKLLTTERLKLG